MKKISITDVTLKTLAKDRDISLLFREKTAVASCADSLGASAVELAPITSLREDTIIYKTVSQNIENAIVAIPVGFSSEDINNAWECVKDAKHPRLQVELPVSTVQMEYIYHMKAEKMLAKIGGLIEEAKKLCDDVEFSALDATRADEEFLVAAIKEAEAKGATVITVCDDAGVSLPEEISALVKKLKAEIKAPLYVQVSDAINMAAACAVSAICAGADGLKAAMVGKDALLTGEIADVIKVKGDSLKIEASLKNTRIHAGIDDLLKNINHEAYEDGIKSDSANELYFDADITLAQVSQSAALLGYDLSDEDCGNVHKALIQVCEKKGSVGTKEFEALIASSAMQAPSTYHLESYTTNCGNLVSSMSQVTLKCGDEILCGVSVGDGPVDSVFRAIEQCIGYHYELDDFQIHAVTEGKEALGSALVKLRNNGKLYSGNGTSTDIVAASVRAYINALNKIVYEEE